MSNIPGVADAYQYETPHLAATEAYGSYWNMDWRDVYPVAPDEILNHDQPAYLGVYDATESVTDWNPWEGRTGPDANIYGGNAPGYPGPIRYGYGTRGIQEHRQAAPLAIDVVDMQATTGQAILSGVSSLAALVPFLELPDAGIGTNDLGDGQSTPYHFDYGLQGWTASAIGPRQIFREPPSYGDQSAAVYAAGL